MVLTVWLEVLGSLCGKIRKTETDRDDFLLEQRVRSNQLRSRFVLRPSLEEKSFNFYFWPAWFQPAPRHINHRNF